MYEGEKALDEGRRLQWIHHAYGEQLKADAVRSVPFRMDYTNGSSCLIFRSAPVTQRADGHVSLNPSLMKTPPLWPLSWDEQDKFKLMMNKHPRYLSDKVHYLMMCCALICRVLDPGPFAFLAVRFGILFSYCGHSRMSLKHEKCAVSAHYKSTERSRYNQPYPLRHISTYWCRTIRSSVQTHGNNWGLSYNYYIIIIKTV